jgi:tetratricopeptide (TPR) repeat protein
METPPPLQSDKRPSGMGPLALYAMALLAWFGALFPGGFSFDDRQAILESPYVRGEQPLLAAFTQDYWHHIGDAGHFRPTASLSLRLDHAIFGEWARGYHMTSVFLHGLVVLLAGLLVVRVAWPGAETTACLFGLGLFAIHPALADSVAWISGRTSTLAILPGLAAALALNGLLQSQLAERRPGIRLFAIALAFLFALLFGLFGKEDGFWSALFPALVLWKHCREARTQSTAANLAAASVGLLIGLFVYGYLRQIALGSAWPSAPHAPLAGVPFFQRMGASGAALVEGGRLLVWPFDQVPNYRAQDWLGASPAIATLGWSLWLLSLTIGAKLCLGLRRAFHPRYALSLSLLLAPISALPVLQIVPAGEVFAGRFLYVPLLLATPALGYALHRITTGLARPKLVIAAAAGLVLACLPAARNYGSNRAYEQAILERYPMDRAAWNGLGLALENEADLEGARHAWRRAIEIDSTYGRPHSNLGRVALQVDGDQQLALEHFQRAAQLGLGNPTAWINLGSMQLRMQDPQGAASSYGRATGLAPGSATAWLGLGRSWAELGQFDNARVAYDRATGVAPLSVIAWTGLAKSLQELGELNLAADALEQAKRLDPANR